MQKITEIKETKYKTVREKDATGKRIPKQVAYTAFRKVNVISGGKRFAHAFVDGIVYYVIYYFVEYLALSISSSSSNQINTLFIGFFISVIFMFSFPIYYIVFEHFFQKTPGKFLTKAIVIDVYGNKPEIGTNILRNIIRLVPFETFSCLSERGWHDRWSETFVVSEEEYAKIKELQHIELIESNEDVDQELKPVNTKRIKQIFLYVILPLSFILYIGIIVKSCTSVKDAFTNLDLKKHKGSTSETDEIDAISDIYNNGQIDEAQKRLLEFTNIHKNYSLAWTLLGHTYFDQKNNEKAIEAYQNGIKANKNEYAPHNGLFLVYSNEGEYQKAMKEIKIADILDPNNSAVIGNMANLYSDMGDVKNAIKFGERSVKLDSLNPTLLANLSIYYFENNQFKERNSMFIKSAELEYENLENLCEMIYPTDLSDGYLNLSGNITHGYTDKNIKGVKIEVFNKDSVLVRETYTDKEGKYELVLPLEISDKYLVKVSYPKYIHKYFVVNTEKVPVEEWKTKAPEITADIALSEKIEGVDYGFLNKPLNRYFFNLTKNNFDHDKALLDASIKKLKDLKSIEQKMKRK